jgi:ABC-type sulfate transport system permease component
MFPVLWLILTSLRPVSGVYYVHRGLEFTLGNFAEVLRDERIVHAFVNSGLIATLATVLSLMVTVSSGYMLSRFRGPIARTWFGTIYVFRCVPYISWVLPLYFVTQSWGIYDSYLGVDRWLHPMGGIFAGCAAIGHPGDLRIGGIVLAVYLERILVCTDPHRPKDSGHYRRHGAIRERDGPAVESNERHGGDGPGAGILAYAVRTEICRPRA